MFKDSNYIFVLFTPLLISTTCLGSDAKIFASLMSTCTRTQTAEQTSSLINPHTLYANIFPEIVAQYRQLHVPKNKAKKPSEKTVSPSYTLWSLIKNGNTNLISLFGLSDKTHSPKQSNNSSTLQKNNISRTVTFLTAQKKKIIQGSAIVGFAIAAITYQHIKKMNHSRTPTFDEFKSLFLAALADISRQCMESIKRGRENRKTEKRVRKLLCHQQMNLSKLQEILHSFDCNDPYIVELLNQSALGRLGHEDHCDIKCFSSLLGQILFKACITFDKDALEILFQHNVHQRISFMLILKNGYYKDRFIPLFECMEEVAEGASQDPEKFNNISQCFSLMVNKGSYCTTDLTIPNKLYNEKNIENLIYTKEDLLREKFLRFDDQENNLELFKCILQYTQQPAEWMIQVIESSTKKFIHFGCRLFPHCIEHFYELLQKSVWSKQYIRYLDSWERLLIFLSEDNLDILRRHKKIIAKCVVKIFEHAYFFPEYAKSQLYNSITQSPEVKKEFSLFFNQWRYNNFTFKILDNDYFNLSNIAHHTQYIMPLENCLLYFLAKDNPEIPFPNLCKQSRLLGNIFHLGARSGLYSKTLKKIVEIAKHKHQELPVLRALTDSLKSNSFSCTKYNTMPIDIAKQEVDVALREDRDCSHHEKTIIIMDDFISHCYKKLSDYKKSPHTAHSSWEDEVSESMVKSKKRAPYTNQSNVKNKRLIRELTSHCEPCGFLQINCSENGNVTIQ